MDNEKAFRRCHSRMLLAGIHEQILVVTEEYITTAKSRRTQREHFRTTENAKDTKKKVERVKEYLALSGLEYIVDTLYPGRCPGLTYFAPLGRELENPLCFSGLWKLA